ncbi:MAG: peptidylprolyl isomerase [Pseudomonadota bacterium]|nr:peptidylprolyl isomerase [Pseudomonadota bacterium]
MRNAFISRFLLTTLLSLSTLFAHADENAATPAARVNVLMSTSEGDIVLQLDRANAPVSVDNFLTYVSSGHYDGTIFHRVIKDFMIQGGGFSADMRRKATLPAIKNEADNGLKNLRGTIAMARTRDVNSATSQFFINVKDNSFLDHGARDFGYAVFGKVVSGMDIVDRIANAPTGPRDVPVSTVTINSVTVTGE